MPPQLATASPDLDTSRRRRMSLLVLASCVLAIVTWMFVGIGQSDTSARDALDRRLDLGVDPPRFSFTYQRGGTRALDCLLTNLRFMAEVDAIEGEMIVRSLEPTRTIAVANREQLWLHRSLFHRPPFETTWLALRRDGSGLSATGAVRRSLGVDLGSTLLSDGLPPNGHKILRATLDIADSVQSIEPITLGTTRADGFRLTVDAAEFANEAPVPERSGNTPDPASELLPVLDAWVTPRGDVVRVEVRPAERDGTIRAPEEGWRLDFGTSAGISAPKPPTPATTDAARVDTDELRPSKEACRLPV